MNTQQTVTVQQTAKIWKSFALGAWMLWAAAVGLIFISGQIGSGGGVASGFVLFALGLVVRLVGGIGAWWNHA